jgi:hypothetical protein
MLAVIALLSQKPASTKDLVCIFPWQFTCRKLSSCSEFLADTGFLCDESFDALGHDNPHAGEKVKHVGLKLQKEQCSSVNYLPFAS